MKFTTTPIIRQDGILKRMFRVAFLTTCVIELSQVGASLIDGIITSRFLGIDEMAAIGIALPYFSIAGVISGCISVGMQTMCTREAGRGKIENMNRIFSAAVTTGALLALLITLVFLLFASPIAALFGAKGDAGNLLDLTGTYLTGLAIGTPAMILNAILSPAAQLDNGSKAVRNASIIIAVTDIAGDLLAVKLRMGMFGIGLATSLSSLAGFFVLAANFVRKDSIIRFRFTLPDRHCMKEMTALGIEKLVRRTVNIFRPILLNTLVIAAGGNLAMSVMSIRNSVNNFIEIPGAGIAGAVAVLSGIFYGEVNEDDIQKTACIAHRYSFICALCSTLLVVLLAKPLAVFYLGKDNEGIPLLVFAFVCLGIRSVFSNLTTARVSYLQALHKIVPAQILSILLNLVCITFSAAILGRLFGTYGIMAAFPVSEFLVMIMIYGYYAIREKRVLPSREDYMSLDRSFHIGPGDVIDLPISGPEDAALTSAQIALFCKGHGFDTRRAFFAGLCAEETARNIIEQEFEKDEKPHSVDIRVVLRGDDLILRFRDNCPSYNMIKQAKMIRDNADPAANAGIRIIQKTAKDISYYRTMETNTTIITI